MSMKTLLCAFSLALFAAPAARAQEMPKPGPEHEVLKKLEGTWEATMKAEGMESKGTMVYKMEMGGLWLTSAFDGNFAGMKFSGRGLDTYDSTKKKYVGVWADSMSTSPMHMEGTYDKEKKTMTLVGDGPGPDGKPANWKSVTITTGDDTMVFHMYLGDGKEPMFTINYKRKK